MENKTGFKFSWYVDQRALLEFNNHFNTKLDDRDFAIVLMLSEFSNTSYCQKLIEGNQSFFRFHWSLVPKQFPLFSINSDKGVKKRYTKLVEAGLLIPQCVRGADSKTYFMFGENFKYLINTRISKELPTGELSFPKEGNSGSYYNTNNNNKEEKEATTDVIEEHKQLIKKIAAYLDSVEGKNQIDYWMQTAMFKGDIKEAIADFTDYWWGQGHQSFKNNPTSFLNKKLVSWLKRRKKSPQRQSKTASKAIEKESIEAYVDNTHGKKQRSLKKYYKEKYFNIEAFKAFSPSIKQTAFEFDMLHGKLQDSKPTKMRKANFKKFYQSLTDNQRKFADSIELYNKYLNTI